MKRHGNCKLTIEQEKEAKELYLKGVSIKDLEKKYHVGHAAIHRSLMHQGLILNRENDAIRKRKIKPEQENDVIALYLSGLSASKISKQYGCTTPKQVLKILKRNKTKIRENRAYHFNEHAFDTINDEFTHYWLGFIYADANVNHNALRFGLSPKDKIQLVKVRDFMKGDMPIRQTDVAVSIEFHSTHTAEQLSTKGIIAYRSRFDLTIPHIKPEYENHFIRGYLDGDGCISVNEQVVFLGQIDILTWIRNVLNRECESSMSKIRPRQGIHEISWGGIIQARKIVNYLYRDSIIWLERKRLVAENWRCGE